MVACCPSAAGGVPAAATGGLQHGPGGPGQLRALLPHLLPHGHVPGPCPRAAGRAARPRASRPPHRGLQQPHTAHAHALSQPEQQARFHGEVQRVSHQRQGISLCQMMTDLFLEI